METEYNTITQPFIVRLFIDSVFHSLIISSFLSGDVENLTQLMHVMTITIGISHKKSGGNENIKIIFPTKRISSNVIICIPLINNTASVVGETWSFFLNLSWAR